MKYAENSLDGPSKQRQTLKENGNKNRYFLKFLGHRMRKEGWEILSLTEQCEDKGGRGSQGDTYGKSLYKSMAEFVGKITLQKKKP